MTTPLIDDLTSRFSAAFAAIGADASMGAVVPAKSAEFGQFQCNGAMGAAKALKKNPREVAQAVVDRLKDDAAFAELSLAGPGFVNIRLADAYLAGKMAEIAADERLGVDLLANAPKTVVDYGGPNVAKPMHVGHLRSSIIGDAIVRIMRFMGHEVLGDIHMGDFGTQMGMLIFALKEKQPGLPYFDAAFTGPYPPDSPVTIGDLQEMYPVISGRCKTDEAARKESQLATVELQQGRPGYRALWRHFVEISVAEMKEDFAALGVTFDLWYGESAYDAAIPAMVAKMRADGHAVEDQGALVLHVAEESENKPMPPVMLLKSDGGANYHTTDLATIQQRVGEFGARLILYVVDKRQSLHFEQLFRAARKTGINAGASMEHLPFGTMNGPDGRPFKTREGGVMRLKDLIAMMTEQARLRMAEAEVAAGYPDEEREGIARLVGLAALRFADLQNVRTADYVFDIERFTKFEGRTGPYLLYAAVRVKSILRKAAEQGFAPGAVIAPSFDAERALMLALAQLPGAISAAHAQRMPHHLCAFAYDIAAAFSSFYNGCHILSEEDAAKRGSWLGLSALVLRELELVLGLLGIRIPERM